MFCQVVLTDVTRGSSFSVKLTSGLQYLNAACKLVAVGSGVLNYVRPLDCHALVKFTLVAAVPSFEPAGNDVRAVQDFHADVKLAQTGA